MKRLVFLFLFVPFSCLGSVGVQLVQFPIEGNQTLDSFWAKVEAHVLAGRAHSPEIVVFPELISLDLWPLGKPESKDEKGVLRTIAGHSAEIAKRAGKLARLHRILLVAGSTPRLKGGKLVNSLILALPSGEILYQDKMHLTQWEIASGLSPGNGLVALKLPWGTLVALTCYDSEIPQISQQLGKLRPELILIPSMTDDTLGRTRVRFAAQARAVEHLAYVALTGTVGSPVPTFTNDGQAVFLAPPTSPFSQVVLSEGTLNQEQDLFAVLDMEILKEARKAPPVYPGRDQRPVRIVPHTFTERAIRK